MILPILPEPQCSLLSMEEGVILESTYIFLIEVSTNVYAQILSAQNNEFLHLCNPSSKTRYRIFPSAQNI